VNIYSGSIGNYTEGQMKVMPFLPISTADLEARGTPTPDIVMITGDAYVDHPSFGAALIGRLLEAEGYSVGIIARPDPDDVEAFRLLGRPRLAFLVTAGALDSMVCSYTANRKPRSEDDYAPGGRAELCLRGNGSIGVGKAGRAQARPDRALITYVGKCREAFKGVPVIIGGLEASLRRLSHYDYRSDTVRRSILLDTKADLLVYGMGESAIGEIVRRLAAGEKTTAIRGVRGTVWRSAQPPELPDAIVLPSHELVADDKRTFAASFRTQYLNTDPFTAKPLEEPCAQGYVVQEAPAYPLDGPGLDRVYELPYTRDSHPCYEPFGGVPALAEVRFSLVSSRGCFGACSFCSLSFHQGRIVTARSHASLLREASTVAGLRGFKGSIHDVGGPTANFRGPACSKMGQDGACVDRRCLAPEPCRRLLPDHRDYLELLRALRRVPGVTKVFIRSGLRFDYLMLDPNDLFFRELVEHHVSGRLKVAPEHVSAGVLALMGKPRRSAYDAFAKKFSQLSKESGKRQQLVPYFISAHPGAGLDEAVELAEYLRDTGFMPDQVQDFYPTPGTLSTAMYWTGIDPLTGEPVRVARGARERAMQRALLQYSKPENHALVREALLEAGRGDLIGRGPLCLVT